ncbi:uncharacterized protein C8Q71DRAFT_475207 [Rhodofomes roseus]|uniref:Uncharacterized protein n=1 Tax=Rhodofomes roseus TaxID=34475 RepID=A0ABQ8KNP6_9APHY|nr:uncharacterized protein C8Q71DRAFT_475207 [Rhodofomes roseus]KAH9840048.1 hypothetical protein C8Q71DRAFT_475207 [Rhodofomes roseus]
MPYAAQPSPTLRDSSSFPQHTLLKRWPPPLFLHIDPSCVQPPFPSHRLEPPRSLMTTYHGRHSTRQAALRSCGRRHPRCFRDRHPGTTDRTHCFCPSYVVPVSLHHTGTAQLCEYHFVLLGSAGFRPRYSACSQSVCRSRTTHGSNRPHQTRIQTSHSRRYNHSARVPGLPQNLPGRAYHRPESTSISFPSESSVSAPCSRPAHRHTQPPSGVRCTGDGHMPMPVGGSSTSSWFAGRSA